MKTSEVLCDKTLVDHVQTLNELVKLKLWFVHHHLAAHGDESFYAALIERVDIWRKTHFNNDSLLAAIDESRPDWQLMAKDLHACYENNKHPQQRDDFVDAAFAVLKESIARRSVMDFALECRGDHLVKYTMGSIRCDAPNEADPASVFIHIANVIAPRSIFDDPLYLPRCLQRVMDFAEKEYGASRLSTTTWLNSHPAWIAMFPAEWLENMGPKMLDVKWHYGFWGQFINARGCFNYKAAQELRTSGQFPCAMRASSCSFAALRQHLSERH